MRISGFPENQQKHIKILTHSLSLQAIKPSQKGVVVINQPGVIAGDHHSSQVTKFN